MHYIEPKNKDQLRLDNHIDQWVSRDNPVRLIDVIIDKIIQSNPAKFEWKGLSESGRRSYSPSTMIKLYLYGYLNHIPSSRRLEIEAGRNVELIWLLGELQPDFKTIADYRRDNGHQIRFVTIEFRKFLKSNAYIEGKDIGIDGTKIRSVAKKDMLTIEQIGSRLDNIEDKLERYLKDVQQADILEDIKEEIDEKSAGTINLELVEKIAELQQELEEFKKKEIFLKEKKIKRVCESDSEAKLMKMQGGKRPGYNIQAGIDHKYKLIAVAEVTTDECDINQLEPTIKAIEKQLEIIPKEVTADKGYANVPQIMEIEKNQITQCYIPLPAKGKENQDIREGISFVYDQQKDQIICSEGQILVARQKNKKEGNQFYNVYQGTGCNECRKKEQCTSSDKGRMIKIDFKRDEWVEKYKDRISTNYGMNKIKERKSVVEHPFGNLKNMMGKIPLLLRGKAKVQIEIDLYTTGYNIKRLTNIEKPEYLIQLVHNYNWKSA